MKLGAERPSLSGEYFKYELFCFSENKINNPDTASKTRIAAG
jgi:hypothetical protein